MTIPAAASNPGNPALAQFILAVASGLTVVVLGYIANMLRRFMGEHKWLMDSTKQNTEAIRMLLEERKPRKKHR